MRLKSPMPHRSASFAKEEENRQRVGKRQLEISPEIGREKTLDRVDLYAGMYLAYAHNNYRAFSKFSQFSRHTWHVFTIETQSRAKEMRNSIKEANAFQL